MFPWLNVESDASAGLHMEIKTLHEITNLSIHNHHPSDCTQYSCPDTAPITENQCRVLLLIAFWCSSDLVCCVLKQLFRMRRHLTSEKCLKMSHCFEAYHGFSHLLCKFGLILLYFFICDRTTIFEHADKSSNRTTLILAIILCQTAGLVGVRKSANTSVNHVDITLEWRGWMQLYLMVYHYSDAYEVTLVYQFARICVAAYLFLSGFGHFNYFWHRTMTTSECEYSLPLISRLMQCLWPILKRYMEVMFRLNFLVAVLCVLMNRPYTTYYFVPLTSSWFTIILVFMAVWFPLARYMVQIRWLSRSRSWMISPYAIMLGHFLLVFGIIETCHRSTWPFVQIIYNKQIERPYKLDDTVIQNDWSFRWILDRYSVLYGMWFSLLLDWLRSRGFLGDGDIKTLTDATSANIPHKTVLGCKSILKGMAVVILSIQTMTASLYIGSLMLPQSNSLHYFKVHPYTCWIPILGYMLVRNSCRTTYSSLFACFGKMSLELYIAQYHIWMSNDASRRLILLQYHPRLNFILVTSIFICICHELHKLTGELRLIFVPQKPQELWTKGLSWILFLLLFTHIPISQQMRETLHTLSTIRSTTNA